MIEAGSDASARAYRLMARVEESEHHDHAAASTWLGRAAGAAGDPAWTCQSCGTAAEQWHALCPGCHGVDTLRWQAPRRAALPAPSA
ncbi:MAG: hypothetical protein U1E97_10940 [Alphaproteobacteria bacterium]